MSTATVYQADLARYAKDPVAWAESPVGFHIPETRAPIVLEPHQREVLRLAFERDADGRFRHDTILYSTPKKSGKTTIGAQVAQWWALTQEPFNEIYCLANDLEQSQGRVFRAARRSIEMNPALRDSVEITNREIHFPATGTSVFARASDYQGESGANPGLTVWDELWGYTSEDAHRLWDELTPSPTRRDSIRFIATYAGFEGESKLLWSLYQMGLAGERIHPELPCYRNGRLFMYWDHFPRMPWQTPAYYESQRASLRRNAFIRMHENRWVTSESAFVPMECWDRCVDQNHRPMLPSRAKELCVGVDAATKRDTAAAVGCWFDEKAGKVVVAWHRIWRPQPNAPIDLEETAEEFLLESARSYRLRGVWYDPYQFIRSASTLNKAGLKMQEFPQSTPNLTEIGQNLYELILGRNLVVYPDPELRQAVDHAVAIETPRGWRIAKEKASHKIDVVVALAMACHAAVKNRRRPIAISFGQSDALNVLNPDAVPPGYVGGVSSPKSPALAPTAEEATEKVPEKVMFRCHKCGSNWEDAPGWSLCPRCDIYLQVTGIETDEAKRRNYMRPFLTRDGSGRRLP